MKQTLVSKSHLLTPLVIWEEADNGLNLKFFLFGWHWFCRNERSQWQNSLPLGKTTCGSEFFECQEGLVSKVLCCAHLCWRPWWCWVLDPRQDKSMNQEFQLCHCLPREKWWYFAEIEASYKLLKTNFLCDRPTCRHSQGKMSLEINDIITFLCTHPQRPVLRCKSFNNSQDEAELSANKGKISEFSLLKISWHEYESVLWLVGINAGVWVYVNESVCIISLHFTHNTADHTCIVWGS